MIRVRSPRSDAWHIAYSTLLPTMCGRFFLIAEREEFNYIKDTNLDLCAECMDVLHENMVVELKQKLKSLNKGLEHLAGDI